MKTTFCFLFALLVCTAVAQIIPNQYLVQFRDNTPAQVRKYHMTNFTSQYKTAVIKSTWEIEYFSGYSATILDYEAIAYLSNLPEVKVVESDQVVRKVEECLQQPTNRGTWGLNRISRSTLLSDAPFLYHENSGFGVDSYIIDTGIYAEHNDFSGRAVEGANFIPNSKPTDENGHGTHVAGTIGGDTYGIAKKTTLIGVKVLGKDGSGTLAGVIDGVSWVNAQKRTSGRPSTANMSLGASYSKIVNDAVDALVNAGVFVAVAAGNSNADACNASPASAALATCVGATSSSDIRAYFSNYGKCVDIMAPGVDIASDWIGSPSAVLTISGTSMASPHVAGVASAYISAFPNTTPAQMALWLKDNASRVNLGDLRGSPDLLLKQGCFKDTTM